MNSHKSKQKGCFITLYGVNNIGKSTQRQLLCEYLQRHGFKVCSLKYPIYDLQPTGPKLNQILRTQTEQHLDEKELQTLFMQNREDFEPQLQQLLKDGTIVVAEDYSGTGIAWGTAKGVPLEEMEKMNQHLRKEDLAILITGKRFRHAQEKNHLHEQNDELVEKVQTTLLQLAKKYQWQVVEQQPRIEATAALIWQIVERFLVHDEP